MPIIARLEEYGNIPSKEARELIDGEICGNGEALCQSSEKMSGPERLIRLRKCPFYVSQRVSDFFHFRRKLFAFYRAGAAFVIARLPVWRIVLYEARHG